MPPVFLRGRRSELISLKGLSLEPEHCLAVVLVVVLVLEKTKKIDCDDEDENEYD